MILVHAWEQASHGGELTGAAAAGLIRREDVTHPLTKLDELGPATIEL